MEEIQKVSKEIEQGRLMLYQELKQIIPNLPDNYSPDRLVRYFKRNSNTIKRTFYEQGAILFVLKKMESQEEFERIIKERLGISRRMAYTYLKGYQKAIEHGITAERIIDIGPTKFALIAGAPDEYIEEFKEKGTIAGQEIGEMSREQIKELIQDLENFKEMHEVEMEKTEFELNQEKAQKDQLFKENKELKRQLKELKQKIDLQERGLFDWEAEDVLNRVLVALIEANRFLSGKPIENEVEQALAEAKLKMVEEEMHRLLHHIRGLAFPEPFDPDNPEVQRVMNDDRFDWTKLDEIDNETNEG